MNFTIGRLIKWYIQIVTVLLKTRAVSSYKGPHSPGHIGVLSYCKWNWILEGLRTVSSFILKWDLEFFLAQLEVLEHVMLTMLVNSEIVKVFETPFFLE